jgi:hypothetical protein
LASRLSWSHRAIVFNPVPDPLPTMHLRAALLTVAMLLAALAQLPPAHAQCGTNPASCCIAHASPGCSDQACCQVLCGADPFCCSVQWDAVCAALAQANCGVCGVGCGVPSAGGCCAPKLTPACSNAPCCTLICASDSFCCDVEWDQFCAQTAVQFCGICSVPCGGGSSEDCCVPHEGPGCSNEDCCEAICGVDPFCCENEWDNVCAGQAQLACGVCGVGCGDPASGDCCEAQATPACSDTFCCTLICAADSFCCDVQWDEKCATAAIEFCGTCADECGSPAAGECCIARMAPSCSDAICCERVCAADPFCCTDAWDAVCANAALDSCGICGIGCGAPGSGDCCTPHATPSCSDGLCCEAVCAFDGLCCEVAWDAACAEAAGILCGDCGGVCGVSGGANCCQPSNSPGCADANCCLAVCVLDPFCCVEVWDEFCANIAAEGCTVCTTGCGLPDAGDCCEARTTPACSDSECCLAICTADPFCCEGAWDQVCADEAILVCGACSELCGSPLAGDCCSKNGTPSCSDAACCEAVCAVDSFCCGIEWDDLCAKRAADLCESCGTATTGDLNGDGTVNAADLALLLSGWGTAATDLNGDGTTGAADLGILLNNWGS